jgi:glycosyltransferase involved in cell wall biosynthesis
MSALLETLPRQAAPARPSVLRRLWRQVPLRRRIQLQSNITQLIAPLPDRDARGGFPLAIAGLFSTASGIGEGARLAYAALDAAGLAPTAFDLSGAFGQTEFSASSPRRALAPGGGSLIVHHNAPYMPHALWALGRGLIQGRRIIGYWAWELPKLPPLWLPGFRFVHEIWVPSTLTRDAVAAATDLPVHVVPHPLPKIPATPNMRGRLGLPQDALVVLNVSHLGSATARKNPLAAIAAFRKAFGERSDRVLAIKLIDNGAQAARHELDAAIAGSSNIRVIEGTLPQADMAGLMAAADIVISLHRSEGFGLVPAQAMALGKPVVATGWSGNLDFMNERNSALVDYSLVPVRDPEGAFDEASQQWAEPDIDHAAEWLRRLAESRELRASMGAQAAASVNAQLAPEKFVRNVTALIGSEAKPAQSPARQQAAGQTPRIAINGRFLTQNTLGVQRFAIESVQAIDALLDTDDYRALKGRIEIVAPAKARDFPLKNIPLRRAGFFSGYAWEQLELPLHAAGRLLLNLCMLGPLLTRHQLVVVHDATVRALPDNFSWRFRAAYGFLIPRLCKRADRVVTVSEFSRQEIGKWYGADTAKMPVCYEGGDHIGHVNPDASALDRFGLAGKKYFLGVGVGSSNKNIETVLAAFLKAQLGDTLLVLTGKRDAAVHGALTQVHSQNVRNVGHVSDAELRALYEHALALVFPSRYEGFGLPAAEAISIGCPVVISDQPALVEVCGDAALRVGMDDVDALARHLRALETDGALRARLAAAGRERARRFTWAATARMLLDQCMALGAKRT